MSVPESKMVESVRYRIAEIVLEQEDENEALIPVYDPVIPIAPIICAHLKFLMSTVIHRMAMQKRKYLFPRALLKREVDPKNASSGSTSKVVYENTLFTAEDFYHMLRANPQVIPYKPVYNLLIERLLSNMFLKRSLKVKRALEMKRALKQKEDDNEETS